MIKIHKNYYTIKDRGLSKRLFWVIVGAYYRLPGDE